MKKNVRRDVIGIGRRKTAVATVRLVKDGSGKININKKEFTTYFPIKIQRDIILEPMQQIEYSSSYDIVVRVCGGGIEAQAESIRLGIARALVKDNEDLKATLKDLGLLTRDSRKKERKKYGLAGARKRFQFSKR